MCRPDDVQEFDPLLAAHKKDQSLPSGYERRKGLIMGGMTALSILFASVYFYNPDIAVNPKFCEDDTEVCRRPDLVAYKANSLAGMLVMGLMGIYNWHFTTQLRQMGKSTPEDRMFGYLTAADYHNSVILCYQVWDFVISITIPENLDPIFLAHHILALISAYCSLEYQMVPYYSVYFGGCSEFSSIFLVFLDKKDMFPITPGSPMDKWVLVCKGMFFLTFSYYRIVGWIQHSITLWSDCHAVIKSGSIEQHRPGKTFFLRVFQGLDFTLGVLQCYWYYSILKAVAAILS